MTVGTEDDADGVWIVLTGDEPEAGGLWILEWDGMGRERAVLRLSLNGQVSGKKIWTFG